jgi:hypothetical protein
VIRPSSVDLWACIFYIPVQIEHIIYTLVSLSYAFPHNPKNPSIPPRLYAKVICGLNLMEVNQEKRISPGQAQQIVR